MSFKFGKNGGKAAPQVTHFIDIATDSTTQASENWTLFMEICDLINSSEEGPKDAAKAIRKKFATKNPPTITLSLSLLETCVKNCGKRFHVQIATKDFLQDFIKIISPKHSPPIELQMNVLGLLQTLAYAFQSSPELREVGKLYQELKNKGVEFPPLDVEKATQAHIPSKSTPTVAVTDMRAVNARASTTGQQCMSSRVTSSGTRTVGHGGGVPRALTPDHLAKLHSELNTVQQNCRVFGEMLTELTPGQESKADMELLEDLNMTCRQMQKRIMELIQVVQMEQVTEELLGVNDELNNVFLRYERYQRQRPGQPTAKLQSTGEFSMPPGYSPSASLAAQSTAVTGPMPAVRTANTPYPPAGGIVAVDNLIDLGETPSPRPAAPYPGFESQFTNMSIHSETSRVGLPQSRDEFGVFAGAAETSRAAAVEIPSELGRDTEFEEMEKWLMENTGGAGAEVVTSSEFDKFLSERAREADCLPVARTTPGQESSAGRKDANATPFSL